MGKETGPDAKKTGPDDPAAGGGPDPGLFFRPLSAANPPEEFWAGFWPSIRAGIREGRMLREGLVTRSRALLLGSSAGLMAAAAVLAAVFLVIPASKTTPVRGTTVPKAQVAVSHASPRQAPSPPILEDLRSASARVYTFHVGEPADATDVILIVDESLDI